MLPRPLEPVHGSPPACRQLAVLRAGTLLIGACLGGSLPAARAADIPIPVLQGSAAHSPYAGQRIGTTGVVTAIVDRGFFLQDPQGDGDAATSDGIFVAGSPQGARVGQRVRVSALVAEVNVGAAGNATTAAQPLTTLSELARVDILGEGVLPEPVVLPWPLAEGDSLERFEGMRVAVSGPLTVQQNQFLARFGQLTLGAGGRHWVPTERHRPGSREAQALAQAQARHRLLLDDGHGGQNRNPTPYLGPQGQPRVGDQVEGLVGVLDFGLATSSPLGAALYRLHPTQPPRFVAANARPPAPPPPAPGQLRLATLNLHNYFTTFGDGRDSSGGSQPGCSLDGVVALSHCRGASQAAEFARQQRKLVHTLLAMDADAVGLVEVQNNGGAATRELVAALNRRLGEGRAEAHYAALPEADQGQGGDAIRVALIYRPARLRAVGALRVDSLGGSSRPSLAQTFEAGGGERLLMVVNHFKSKGSCPTEPGPDADQRDGQACWNALRVRQSRRLAAWVDGLPAAAVGIGALLIGDFNAYTREDPVVELVGRGFVDLLDRHQPAATTFVYDGLSGRLDHALAGGALAARVRAAWAWPINADEQPSRDYNLEFRQPACAQCAPDAFEPEGPWRSSDHDPVLVELDLRPLQAMAAGR